MNPAEVQTLVRDAMRDTPMFTTPHFDRLPAARRQAMKSQWNDRVERRLARGVARALTERALARWLGLLACRLALVARTEGAVH